MSMSFFLRLPFIFFFFNDTATPEIYTLSLHDALPIFEMERQAVARSSSPAVSGRGSMDSPPETAGDDERRSEEHTSELQSQSNLVCRLLLEKKKNMRYTLCTATW